MQKYPDYAQAIKAARTALRSAKGDGRPDAVKALHTAVTKAQFYISDTTKFADSSSRKDVPEICTELGKLATLASAADKELSVA